VRTEPRGTKARPITNITSTALGKEERRYVYRLFGMTSLKEEAMWHVDHLLGNYREISSYTTAVAR
jgi:Uri superfamily endonuclease